MPKVTCKNGICTVKRLPKKSAKSGGAINLPGFPPNVLHTPQAAAQYAARNSINAVNGLPPSSNEDVQRRIISTQLSPLNAQSNQQPSQNINIGPALSQQNPSSLQQNLAPLQGQNDTEINGLLDKVDSDAPLSPQEAQTLNSYIQQYLPQQQQDQYNPQDYLKGPLTGLFQDQSQSPDIPYEQSPFFQAANQIQNNQNAPAALKQRSKKPGFWKRLWNVIKSPFVSVASKALSRNQPGRVATGSPGSVQAGQQQQGQVNDPYGLSQDNSGLSQVLSPTGEQRGSIAGNFFGYHPEVYNISNLTPYQQRASNYVLDQSLRGLQQNQPSFTPIANQQLEQFYTQTVPSLAERFTALGNGQRSSAFQGALANAGRGLHNDLAAQNQQFNQQNRSNYTNLLNFGLTPRFQTALNPGGAGLLPGVVNGAAQLGKAYLSGGLG